MSEVKRYEFSEMRKKLNEAHLEIVKRRQYRGARESDVVAWLADYVEQNFVPKAQLERAEEVIKFYSDSDNWEHKSPSQADYVVVLDDSGTGEFQLNHMTDDDRVGGRRAREYFKKKEQV